MKTNVIVTAKFKPGATNQHHLHEMHAHRLYNPHTKQFLHMSGHGETDNLVYSWSGFQRQSASLKSNAKARGAEWPYMVANLQGELVT